MDAAGANVGELIKVLQHLYTGVSSSGQTCSFYIRSRLGGVSWNNVRELEDYKHKAVKGILDEMMVGQEISPSQETSLRTLREFNRQIDGGKDDELDYITMINRLLPSDIRVLGWAPVDAAFDSRFGCLSRKYHYYFSPAGLDIEKMQEACKLLIGTHDFRNFAKIDTNKVERVGFFTRTVLNY